MQSFLRPKKAMKATTQFTHRYKQETDEEENYSLFSGASSNSRRIENSVVFAYIFIHNCV